jgi:hypothetical protein
MNFLDNRFALLVDKIISSMYKIWTKIPCLRLSYVIMLLPKERSIKQPDFN